MLNYFVISRNWFIEDLHLWNLAAKESFLVSFQRSIDDLYSWILQLFNLCGCKCIGLRNLELFWILRVGTVMSSLVHVTNLGNRSSESGISPTNSDFFSNLWPSPYCFKFLHNFITKTKIILPGPKRPHSILIQTLWILPPAVKLTIDET